MGGRSDQQLLDRIALGAGTLELYHSDCNAVLDDIPSETSPTRLRGYFSMEGRVALFRSLRDKKELAEATEAAAERKKIEAATLTELVQRALQVKPDSKTVTVGDALLNPTSNHLVVIAQLDESFACASKDSVWAPHREADCVKCVDLSCISSSLEGATVNEAPCEFISLTLTPRRQLFFEFASRP